MLDAFGDLGDPPTSDAGLAQARTAVAATGRLRDQLAPYQGGFTTPAGVTYPDDDFAGRLARAGRDGRRRAAAEGGGDRVAAATTPTRTSRQPAGQPARDRRTACAPSSATSRRAASQDRVLVHVWSEFGRRPEENGSGTDHGAAGSGFLIGSKAKGEMVGEFPGLATLDEDDNLRTPPTSAASTARCSSSGSAWTPPRSSRTPPASRARHWWRDARDRPCAGRGARHHGLAGDGRPPQAREARPKVHRQLSPGFK